MKCTSPQLILAFASALLGATCASAQVSVSPASPKAFETVRVIVPLAGLGKGTNGELDRYQPEETQITMVGNKITVSLLMLGSDFNNLNAPVDQPIGQLPSGTYEVEIVKRAGGRYASSGLVGSATFTVAADRRSVEPH